MRILLVKTSSMGDLIHTLPALTDAGKAIADIRFDWVVEESFAEIPTWHPLVDRVIPVALRRWRKKIVARETFKEWRVLRHALHHQSYDLILDAQGLVKSAWLTLLAKGPRAGLDARSAREGLAALFYQKRYTVNFYQHAIVRMRMLFSLALGYAMPVSAPAFSVNRAAFQEDRAISSPYIVFLHGTTWTTKEWPESYWMTLAQLAKKAGFRIKISGGNVMEIERAKRIASTCDAVDVLPRLTISAMATLLANAKAAVAVDTGFGHLSAALNVPTVSLYGPTNAAYTGALGDVSLHLSADFPCAPCIKRVCTYRGVSSVTPACFEGMTPQHVWNKVVTLL